MFAFLKTYTTPSAESLENLSNQVKQIQNQKIEADCKYFSNLIAKLLTESIEAPNSQTHSVDINPLKLIYWINLGNCVGKKHDPLKQMEELGVQVHVKYNRNASNEIIYDKINKHMFITYN